MQGRLLLEKTGDAVFACDAGGSIVAWNRAATMLLGREAEDTLGVPCHEVLCGRDVFGNRYCAEPCPLRASLDGDEPLQGFAMDVEQGNGDPIRVRVSVLVLTDAAGDLLVHLLRPAGAPEASEPAPTSALTARESEVLALLAEGIGPEYIAERLGISVHTARTHIQHIHAKLDAHTTLEAVARTRRCGLV